MHLPALPVWCLVKSRDFVSLARSYKMAGDRKSTALVAPDFSLWLRLWAGAIFLYKVRRNRSLIECA